jgi:CRISPR-associated endonuclease/helicase Cas3
VSFDIDYDILFTENAPIDSLIQRAGRVNRSKKKENTKVIIFKHNELSEKYVYKEIPNILNDTYKIMKANNNKALKENELIELVNDVYDKYDIEQNEEFIKGLNIYNEIQKQNNYIQDLNRK